MFGSVAIQTHCLLFHNEVKATDLDNLSIIGLIAKITHFNRTNKIKAQPTDFFSVSCAFSQLYITCSLTISVARLQILFICCTHSIIFSALSFSLICSCSASDFTVCSNKIFALSSISAR